MLFLSHALFAEKVEIVSDAMQAQNAKQEVHFVGHVKIAQSKTWLHADHVIVYFNDNNETSRYEAKGNVIFQVDMKKSLFKGKAQKVIYEPLALHYKLFGKAVIEDVTNKRYISGEEIIFDAKNGDAKVKGNRKKPVKFIFDMEK